MLSRQDRRQVMTTYIVGFLILFCGCFAVYKLIYEPLKSELIHLHDSLSKSTPANYRLPEVALGHYQPWYKSLQLSSEQLRQHLVSVVDKAQVNLQELRFDTLEQATPFVKIPVYLKIQGKFSHVMQLLVSLANSHLVYSLGSIHLSHASQAVEAVLHVELRKLG